MSNLNTRQAHPLIRREQNYVLDRKLISFHSQDRDISKWSNSNHFEVQLPENLKNVQSMRLDAITFPNSQLIFSTAYQNTKLSFKINENMHVSALMLGLINKEKNTIDYPFILENSKRLAPSSISMENKNSITSWVLRNKEAVKISDLTDMPRLHPVIGIGAYAMYISGSPGTVIFSTPSSPASIFTANFCKHLLLLLNKFSFFRF
jgi:hypothetical protein